jgi:hypothetical protein
MRVCRLVGWLVLEDRYVEIDQRMKIMLEIQYCISNSLVSTVHSKQNKSEPDSGERSYGLGSEAEDVLYHVFTKYNGADPGVCEVGWTLV